MAAAAGPAPVAAPLGLLGGGAMRRSGDALQGSDPSPASPLKKQRSTDEKTSSAIAEPEPAATSAKPAGAAGAGAGGASKSGKPSPSKNRPMSLRALKKTIKEQHGLSSTDNIEVGVNRTMMASKDLKGSARLTTSRSGAE